MNSKPLDGIKNMEDINDLNIQGDLYDFLVSNNYKFKKTSSNRVLIDFKSNSTFNPSKETFLDKVNERKFNHFKLIEIDVANMEYKEINKFKNKFNNDFFNFLYKKDKYKKEDLFSSINQINHGSYKKDLSCFFNNFELTNKDLINLIGNLGNVILPITMLDKINSYLLTKNLDFNEEKKFWEKFFKSRVKTINNSNHVGGKVRDFLIQKYSKDDLKDFLSIVDYLSDLYSDNLELDFFKKDSKYQVSIKIDCKKAEKDLMIDKFNYRDIASKFIFISNNLTVLMNLKNCNKFDFDKKNKVQEVVFYSDSEINEKFIENKINNYFLFLKNNTKYTESFDQEIFGKWYMQDELNNKLIDKNNNKKIKI